ncbi:hypothetical protein [Sporisorium scitamineum]|uniref:Uncharacterized protein n=1 Tax=Sporisorium scitamineum TaxID=49012 RepID=A0A0F7S1R0_9BASI|nr:hypothetical protein [Sporisorium scitamineum]
MSPLRVPIKSDGGANSYAASISALYPHKSISVNLALIHDNLSNLVSQRLNISLSYLTDTKTHLTCSSSRDPPRPRSSRTAVARSSFLSGTNAFEQRKSAKSTPTHSTLPPESLAYCLQISTPYGSPSNSPTTPTPGYVTVISCSSHRVA